VGRVVPLGAEEHETGVILDEPPQRLHAALLPRVERVEGLPVASAERLLYRRRLAAEQGAYAPGLLLAHTLRAELRGSLLRRAKVKPGLR
jgi:hypothetical protein